MTDRETIIDAALKATAQAVLMAEREAQKPIPNLAYIHDLGHAIEAGGKAIKEAATL